MKFNCPHCSFGKDVPETLAGRKVRCPKCNQKITVTTLEKNKNSRPRDAADDQTIDFDSGWLDMESSSDLSENASSKPAAKGPAQNRSPPVRPSTKPTVIKAIITKYEVRTGRLGETVAYACPDCGSRLTSPLKEAGGTDRCPDCTQQFVVPGEKERRTTEKERIETAQRKAVERGKRNEASSRAVVNRVAEKNQKQGDLQLDRDPMFEWYIYAAILAGIFALAAGPYIVSAVATDSSYICIVILLLFFLGAFVNFWGMRGLRNEYVCAAVLMNQMNVSTGLSEICAQPAAGVFHQHVIDLGNIARHDSAFTQDSLITLLYSRMMAKSRMVDVLAGVLVTLGLIGTIVGLISMTNGLVINACVSGRLMEIQLICFRG